MKYAHLADLHLGSWREPVMRDLSTKAFLSAMDKCLAEHVDFILFSGDIFNTSLPSLDILKIVTKKLKELQDKGIPLYVIAGSHDFSPSGKTMIDVLEHAGLLKNVCKGRVEDNKLHLRFTVDEKTGAKITGILGRKGQLDTAYYQNLALEDLEQEQGYKIFMFHTTLTELKPKHLQEIDSQPASFLPKGFNYYAGGHIHHKTLVTIPEYGPMTYPGALFPNNFAEVEKYGHGGFYLIQEEKMDWVPVMMAKHKPIIMDCTSKAPEVMAFEILNSCHNEDLTGTVVTLRLTGEGRASEIKFQEIFEKLYAQGALIVMKNTAQMHSREFEEIKVAETDPSVMEERIIKEHLQQMTAFAPEQEFHLAKTLLHLLNTTKQEGETTTDFNQRIEEEIDKNVPLGIPPSMEPVDNQTGK